ncbi:hypothetical protein [Glaciibacter sp. 2TAF33]|uniref:hypothetical protein n=1 Tax=Glaciibacter sp. 2TAF33 TaxID=3233015 RepID=UPI003F93851A
MSNAEHASVSGHTFGPATHASQTPTDKAAPVDDSSAHGPDPELASWAHFTLDVGVPLNRGPGPGAFYDDQSHRYNTKYINPDSYLLNLSAKVGLDLNRRDQSNSSAGSSLPPGKSGGGGPSTKPMIPDDLVAFSWNVVSRDNEFHDTKIIQRPLSPMEIVTFQLPPRPDSYSVRLRVAFADGRFGERTVDFEVRDLLVVSIGDSSASGQGNPDEIGSLAPFGGTICAHPTAAMILSATPPMGNDAQWLERKAYRSLKSVPAQAALSLATTFGSTFAPPDGERHNFSFDRITFVSFARSGAEVLKGLLDPQEGDGDFIGAGQLEECRRSIGGRRIDALLINIGGNDAGFSVVLEDLVKKDTVYTGSLAGTLAAVASGSQGDDKLGRDQVERRLSALLGIGLPDNAKGVLEVHYDALAAMVGNLQASPGIGEVYMTGYPTGLFEDRQADEKVVFRSCEIFDGPDMDITDADAKMVKRHGKHLNDLIERKANEFNWHFVSVEKEFEGHGYCATTSGSFWRKAAESCRTQGDLNGTMHPNEHGVAAWAAKYAEALRAHTLSKQT